MVGASFQLEVCFAAAVPEVRMSSVAPCPCARAFPPSSLDALAPVRAASTASGAQVTVSSSQPLECLWQCPSTWPRLQRRCADAAARSLAAPSRAGGRLRASSSACGVTRPPSRILVRMRGPTPCRWPWLPRGESHRISNANENQLRAPASRRMYVSRKQPASAKAPRLAL